MGIQHYTLLSTCIALLFITSSISESIILPHFDANKRTLTTRTPPRKRGITRNNRGGRIGRSRNGNGSSNCDPLYVYLFGRCGSWPFSRNSSTNPFLSPPVTSPPPPVSPPPSPSPPPPDQSPPPPSPPPPPPSPPPPPPPSPPPPPLVPSPPPPDPTPPVVIPSPPPDYTLPPLVPDLPPVDPLQPPPLVWLSPPVGGININPPPLVPISFSPPADATNPPGSYLLPPLVPIFSPPQTDPGQVPEFPPGEQLPPVVGTGPQFPPAFNPGQEMPPEFDPGQQFPPQLPMPFTPPVESATPFPGIGETPEIIMPPPVDENPINGGQPFFSTPETPGIPIDLPP